MHWRRISFTEIENLNEINDDVIGVRIRVEKQVCIRECGEYLHDLASFIEAFEL